MHLFLALFKLSTYWTLNDLADLSQLPDLQFLTIPQQFSLDINSKALNTLLDCVINWSEEVELIWTVIYNFFPQKMMTRINSTSLSIVESVIVGLYNA